MTESELTKKVLAGEVWAVGEYRASHADRIRWRDQKTGNALEAGVLRHTVEFGTHSATVNEPTESNFDEKAWTPGPTFPRKGERVAVRVLSLVQQKGVLALRGHLEVLHYDAAVIKAKP